MEASDAQRRTGGQRRDLSSQWIPGTPGQVRLPERGGDQPAVCIHPFWFCSLQTICSAPQAHGLPERERPHHHRLGLVGHADAELPGVVPQQVVRKTSRTQVVLHLPAGVWRLFPSL